MTKQIAAVAAVVMTVACGDGGQSVTAPSAVGGADGGRVGTLALRPGELTNGTGTEPGTPGGGGATPGLSCQGGKPWIVPNPTKDNTVHWQNQMMAGATGYDVVITYIANGGVVYRNREQSVFGQTSANKPLAPGRYRMTVNAYRPTCTPQIGDTGTAEFSINGPVVAGPVHPTPVV